MLIWNEKDSSQQPIKKLKMLYTRKTIPFTMFLVKKTTVIFLEHFHGTFFYYIAQQHFWCPIFWNDSKCVFNANLKPVCDWYVCISSSFQYTEWFNI